MPQIQFGHFTRRDVHALDGLRIASSDPLQNDLGINWGKHETIRSKMKRRRKKKGKRKEKKITESEGNKIVLPTFARY